MKRKKGFYSISVVAKMFEVHQQTVRMYEKEGLLTPKRSDGNTRLFSEEDVDRLEEIIYLTHKVGVNLAGVDMILKLKKKISKLQEEINTMLDAARANLDQETEAMKEDTRARAQRLLQMKKDAQKQMRAERVVESTASAQTDEKEDDTDAVDDWQIEYDDEK